MTATEITQERVDEIARGLAPDVVRIRFDVGRDWTDDPAVYFRVVLSDDASRLSSLEAVTNRVEKRIFDELGLYDSDYFRYVRFRSESEQAKLLSPAWD